MSQRRIAVEDQDMGKEALQLTELHGHFGHRYASIGVTRTTSGLHMANNHVEYQNGSLWYILHRLKLISNSKIVCTAWILHNM